MKTVLLKIWIFNIDFGTIVSFLMGILLGAILVCLLYAIFVLASLKNKKFLIKTEEDTLTTTDVKNMILEAQKNFKDKDLRRDISKGTHCKNLAMGLAYGIAARFYPNSKHPLLELSVDEALMLTVYIENRIDEILNRRGIRLLKKIRVSTILEFTKRTTTVVDSKAFKVSKKVNSKVTTIRKVVNVINPVWWFRKLVFDKTLGIVTNKLCLVILAIVGEETYKIYSKTVFHQDVDIESNIDELLSSIDEDLKEATTEIGKKEEQPIEANSMVVQMKSKPFYLEGNMNYFCQIQESFPFKKNECIENYKGFKDWNMGE